MSITTATWIVRNFSEWHIENVFFEKSKLNFYTQGCAFQSMMKEKFERIIAFSKCKEIWSTKVSVDSDWIVVLLLKDITKEDEITLYIFLLFSQIINEFRFLSF